MKRILPLVLFAVIFTTLSTNAQDIVHYWHFNNVSGNLDAVPADVFTGEVAPVLVYQKIDIDGDNIGNMDDVAGTELNARNGLTAGRGIRPRNPSANGELFIELNSQGFENLKVSYATERSTEGMLLQQIWYTTDGQNYETFGNPITINPGYELVNLDFSSIEAANDNPDFALKIRFVGQNTAANGNNRIDNLVLEGDLLGGASIVHYWHFNEAEDTLGVVEADFYTGLTAPTLLYQKIDPNGAEIGFMDDVAGSLVNARMGFAAGNAIRVRNPSNNGELLINLDATGFEDLKLSYATQRSGMGMLEQQLYFTINGTDFFPFGGPVGTTENYELVSYDFSSVTEVNNNPNFAVKLHFFGQNDTPNGNNRIDNIVLQGVSLGGPANGVIMFTDNVTLSVGETSQLSATVLPPTASNQTILWSSEDPGIATVSSSGLLTGISAGNTIVSATSEDGGFQANSFVTVVDPFELTFLINGPGIPLAGALVTLDGETLTTDASGNVVFFRTAGTYSLSVEAAGYVTLNTNVTVTGDQNFFYELSLFSDNLIHYWHFNTLPVGPVEVVPADYSLITDIMPTIVYGFLPSFVEVPGAAIGYMDDYVPGTTLSAQMDEEAGSALRVRNPSADRALIINLPTTGLMNILLSFDVFRSGSGMLNNHFEYTLDGNTWINTNVQPSSVSISTTFEAKVIDFTNESGANDNPNFAVRITYEGNTVQDNGNNRYDNVAMFANLTISTRNAERKDFGLNVFPNPSTGLINVALSEGLYEQFSNYHLYDLSGRRVKSGQFSGDRNTIDAGNLNPGAFILMVENGDKLMQKVVVLSK